MEKRWKEFPKISKAVEKFHLTPSYMVIIKRSGEIDFVNKAGKEFLLKCANSYKNIEEILLEIYPLEVLEDKKEEIDQFIKEAVRRGIIELQKTPLPCEIKITGSEKFYVPIHISLELTSKCNLNCIYCYNEFLSYNEEMDYKILIERLEEWIDLGLIGVELTGGEPFLYSHLKDLVEFCTKNLKSVGILTNGTILNDEWINYFVKVKEKTGTDILFAISLDASSPETFSKITGSYKFHHVINSIKSLSSKGFKVRVGTVISPYNFKELEEIVKLSIENGAYKITWSSVLPFGKGKELAWTKDVQFFKEAQKIERDVYNKYKNFIAYFEQDLWDQINTLVNCGIGHKNVVVSPNGYIRPCLLLPPDFKTCKNCNFKYYCKGCVLRPLSIMEKFPNKDCNWIRENGKIKEILSMKND